MIKTSSKGQAKQNNVYLCFKKPQNYNLILLKNNTVSYVISVLCDLTILVCICLPKYYNVLDKSVF